MMFHDFLQQKTIQLGYHQGSPEILREHGPRPGKGHPPDRGPGGPGGPGGILMDDGQGIHTFIYIDILYHVVYV